MSSKVRLALLGCCMSHTLWRSVTDMQKKGIIPADYTIESWAVTDSVFQSDFFVINEHGFPVLINTALTCKVGDKLQTSTFRTMTIPVAQDLNKDYIYCFSSPIYEIGEFRWFLMRNLVSTSFSYHAMKDMMFYKLAPMIQLLVHLKLLNIKVVAVEGSHFLPCDVNVPYLNKFMNQWRRISKELMDALSIPYLELPSELHDKQGFTLEKYRQNKNDNIHVNIDYGYVVAKKLFSFIEDRNLNIKKSEKWEVPDEIINNPWIFRYYSPQAALENIQKKAQSAFETMGQEILAINKRIEQLEEGSDHPDAIS